MSDGWALRVAGEPAEPSADWTAEWVDPAGGVVRLSNADHSQLAIVEGGGTDWWVVLSGRRIPVSVRSWREQVMAEVEVTAQAAGGPVEIKATLPGLIAAIVVEEGSEVVEGDPLLTLEAMKMQNEVRAPRAGRIAALAVTAGEAVASGQLLLRIE
jgi:acetyl/propionyl-CoA carboxylase alpha subunit